MQIEKVTRGTTNRPLKKIRGREAEAAVPLRGRIQITTPPMSINHPNTHTSRTRTALQSSILFHSDFFCRPCA